MALTAEGVVDSGMLADEAMQDKLADKFGARFTNDTFTADALANDTFTRDTLTKADRLDIAYRPLGAVPAIADVPAQSIAVAEIPPDASATAGALRSAAPHVKRTSVMLPRPRPRSADGIRIAKTSRPVAPALAERACPQPEGLNGILLSFSSQPRCG